MQRQQLSTAIRAGVVTKSDSTVLAFKRLYIGGTGNVVIQQEGSDTSVTYTAVPAGLYLNVSGNRVMAATSATNIVWEDW